MKIVVFAPHPDDEIYGAGGSILKWMEEGHDLHIVYVTDNRALITYGIQHDSIIVEEAGDYINLSEEKTFTNILTLCLLRVFYLFYNYDLIDKSLLANNLDNYQQNRAFLIIIVDIHNNT